VRGTLVCRYIDGLQFVAHGLAEYGRSLGLKCRYGRRQNDRGYYAVHFYVHIPVELVIAGAPKEVSVSVEIQLITQLQELLRGLTHGFYESRRLVTAGSEDWKWEFETAQFQASYVGHMLHYIEGTLVRVRNEVLGVTPSGAKDGK
jgi:ppGpp synthetase/RelA/SpoT-type nucleotidyltranferase